MRTAGGQPLGAVRAGDAAGVAAEQHHEDDHHEPEPGPEGPGGALVAGPIVAQILAHVGDQLGVQSGSDSTFEFSWFLLPDLAFPAVGVAMLLIAGILRQGERLQRETEGLV